MRVDYCILVTLSRETISFRYNRADGDNRFVDFLQDGEGEMSFAIECTGNEFVIGKSALEAAKNKLAQYAFSDIFDTCKSGRTFRYANRDEPLNKLPYYAIKYYIGKILSDCFYGVKGTVESNVARLPLILLFAPELDTDKQLFIRCPFKEGGFQNVCSISYHQLLLPIVMGNIRDKQKTKAVLMVSVDKEDLLLQLYDTVHFKPLGETVRIISQGCDPRIGQVADLIWECLLGYNYQPREPEEGILREAAERFLSSDAMSENDVLCMSDGSIQPYMISRANLVSTSSGNSCRIINHELEVELAKHDLAVSQCQAVLVGKAATDYFENIFNQNPMAGPAKKVTGKEKSKMLDYLLENVKGTGYEVRNLWSGNSSQLTISGKNVAPVNEELVRRYKRRVEVIRKEIERNLLQGNFAEARHKINSLLSQLHNDEVYAYDKELQGLLGDAHIAPPKEVPVEHKPVEQAKQAPIDSHASPQINVREIRQKLAPLRELMRKDYNAAYNIFVELKRQAELAANKSLWDKIEEFAKLFDAERIRHESPKNVTVAKTPLRQSTTKTTVSIQTKTPKQPKTLTLSDADSLLRHGKYHEAKKAYALQHNSLMAEVCSKLIHCNRVERDIESELECVKASRNINKAKDYLEELIKLRNIMQQTNAGIDLTGIEQLIKEYRKIK